MGELGGKGSTQVVGIQEYADSISGLRTRIVELAGEGERLVRVTQEWDGKQWIDTSTQIQDRTQKLRDEFKKFEKQTSGSLKNKLQEVSKANCNNTEYNDNESSKTESYPSIHHDRKDVDKMDERYAYRQIICDNIEYDILCQSYKPESVEELVELMLDAICTTKKYLQINGEAMPAQVVKNRLLKVGYEHIQYVFFSLSKNTTKVKNIRQYMLTVLYNAPVTINQFYDAEVRHDMYGG